MRFLHNLTNYDNSNSFGNRLRNRRFKLIEEHYMRSDQETLKILDVGGTQSYWENRGYVNIPGIEITILNVYREPADYPNIQSTVGHGADLSRYRDNEFDITFSNSVIEHMESWEKMESMAREIRRVGKSYYLQTPNKNFPIECHFLLPWFQFLPLRWKYYILTRTKLSRGISLEKKKALKLIKEIRLLSKRELKKLFPEDTLKSEKFLGFKKSFIVYNFDTN